ncbi:hypothetical protein [Rhodoferax sp.]|uniref:hypothetical protein n=1 Tax=Rhodoferax sp. TaxID=50421 RepID=UPI0025E6EE0E|nr:hypothetical protein [Rhodoferax sp.]
MAEDEPEIVQLTEEVSDVAFINRTNGQFGLMGGAHQHPVAVAAQASSHPRRNTLALTAPF